MGRHWVIGGDTNSKHKTWGWAKKANGAGTILHKALQINESWLTLLNTGSATRISFPGSNRTDEPSAIDTTIASKGCVSFGSWDVHPQCSSDHLPITFECTVPIPLHPPEPKMHTLKISRKLLTKNQDIFAQTFQTELEHIITEIQANPNPTIDDMVEKLSTAFGKASADSKIISRPGPSAGSPHWSPECLEKKRLKRQAEKAVHDIIFPKGTKEDPAHRLPLKDNQILKEAKQCLKHATFNLKKALTDAKDASWQDYVKLIHYKLHPSSVWKHVNQLQASDNNKHTPISLSPHPFNLKSLPSPYTTGGELLYTDKDKANSLAAYYSSISSESSARNKST